MTSQRKAILWLIFLLILVLLIFLGLRTLLGQDWRLINEPLHSTLEAVGSAVAILLGIFLVVLANEKSDARLYLFSLGFLVIGILDGFHAISRPGHGFVLLHSSASFFGSVLFAFVWFPRASLIVNQFSKRLLLFLVASLSVILGLLVIARRDWFPIMVVDGTFTTTAIAMNFFAGMLFLLVAINLLFISNRILGSNLLAYMFVLFGVAGILFPVSTL